MDRVPLLALALLLAGCPGGIGDGLGGDRSLASPTGLTGHPEGGSRILLRWRDNATAESGYRLEVNFGPFTAAVIADVRFLGAGARTFVYPSVPNATYYFRVFAVTDTLESKPSNVIVVKTPDVPLQPTGVTARPDSSSQITVRWTDVAGETGYKVERSSDGVDWTAPVYVAADSVSTGLGGLAADTEYFVRVIAINANGSSTPSDPASTRTCTGAVTLTDVTATGNFGQFTSILLPGGVEQVSHYDGLNGNPVVTARTGPASFFTTTADAGPTAAADVGGDGTSMAVDSAGHLHVVAHNRTNDSLRYATNASGSWTAVTVEAGGARPRIVCDPVTGMLHVVHQNALNSSKPYLRYAWKGAGGSWQALDLLNLPIRRSSVHSLALDGAGVPHIILVADANGSPWHIMRPYPNGAGLTGQEILLPLGQGAPDSTSMVIDPAGVVRVAYHATGSKSLYLLSPSGLGWASETIHSSEGSDVGLYCALAHDSVSGRLHAAYYDATHQMLWYARKDPGGSWIRFTLDASGDVGSHASLALDAAGAIRVAYRDETLKRLRLAVGAP